MQHQEQLNQQLVEKIEHSAKFKMLVEKKTKLGLGLTLIMLVVYYGFILLLAFAPDFVGTPLAAGKATTYGIPMGAVIIVLSFILTGIYVRKANTEFDRLNQEIIEEASK
ncbi:DUF485 domain-containing protein [Neisseria sp. Ec49-e6-T10]|uniref:DUF485 domain-containing protein n=1 Tax=Neisseria sp. Ec49-e6-T10 TaxID=3140744 RepID=UPI003EBD66DD